ncbi:GntR family transcriptional regulator [Paenibacillus sp. sptzw28]|uniref:GntR family transcriptional regulator n=1 Tax=Paenibacillus sp. sptzw28 TaxID=715179 RepID=UPI001C6DDC62|nr:GntR family transcriptional regulator [Paenibacillus sp. sptzw28]QYR20965.1 GntR family transcriptional regulator [Paenibacillus sp. sptzw28]
MTYVSKPNIIIVYNSCVQLKKHLKRSVLLLDKKISEDQIYEILKEAIFNSDLTPGTQLVEMSLAEAFEVSRTPIRAVFHRLKFESLVKIIPNRGAFVYCPTPEEAEHIFSVRKLLEPEAARLAALHAGQEDLDKMEQFLTQEKEYYLKRDERSALKAIAEFHLAVIHASRNDYLIRYLRELVNLTHIILTFYDTADPESPDSPDEHKAIFEAIRKGDGDLAYRLASDHVDFIRSEIDFSRQLNHALSVEQVISRYSQRLVGK